MLNSYPNTFGVLQIHLGDAYATTWGNLRDTFYNVTGTPTAWFDGTLSNVGASSTASALSAYTARYNTRRATPTDVTIALGGQSLGGATYRLEARVCVEPGGAAKTVRIYIAQVLDYWPAVVSYSRYGFKQAAATQDITLAPGQCQTVTRDLVLDGDSLAALANVKIIAWAQVPSASGPANIHQGAVMHWPFTPLDCNNNGIPDPTDIANCDGSLWCRDCNGNGLPDGCDLNMCNGDPACSDCNGNGIPDACDIASGFAQDCNLNGVPDSCDLAGCDGSPWCSDCNGNAIPDECDLASGFASDCNENSIPDSCDLANCNGSPWCDDCNANGILDGCDLSGIPFAAHSPTYAPFGTPTPRLFTIPAPPNTLGPVALKFTGFGDFNYWNEFATVYLNGALVSEFFHIGGKDCETIFETVNMTEAAYNAALAGGDAVFEIVPSVNVDPNWCPSTSIRLDVTYRAAPTAVDGDQNGVPDSCQGPLGCTGDSNCDAVITWRDIDYFVAGLNDNDTAWRALFAPPGPSCPFSNLDCNHDQHVTWRDIDPFIALLNTTCP